MKDFKLDNVPKITSGFTTPEGYFDTFSKRVMTQLPKQESKVISIFSKRKILYYTAVAIVVLTISIPAYYNYSNSKEVSSAELEEYIAYHSTVSEDEIVELLEKEDLDKMKIEFNIQDNEIEDLFKTNTNLEHYLLD